MFYNYQSTVFLIPQRHWGLSCNSELGRSDSGRSLRQCLPTFPLTSIFVTQSCDNNPGSLIRIQINLYLLFLSVCLSHKKVCQGIGWSPELLRKCRSLGIRLIDIMRRNYPTLPILVPQDPSSSHLILLALPKRSISHHQTLLLESPVCLATEVFSLEISLGSCSI